MKAEISRGYGGNHCETAGLVGKQWAKVVADQAWERAASLGRGDGADE
jgi:hypothetical protein